MITTQFQSISRAKKSFETATILEQGSGAVLEDRIVAEDNLFAVLDGATSLGGKDYCGKSGGELAAEIGADYLQKGSGPLAFRIQKANIALKNKMMSAGCDTEQGESLWSTSLAALRLCANRVEWAQIGDCRILFLFKDGSYKLAFQPEDHDKESLSLMADLGGLAAFNDSRMMEQLVRVRKRANKDYGVLNGMSSASHFLKSGYQDLTNVTDIILYSDGLLLPGSEQQSLAQTVSLYRQGGITEVHKYQRQSQRKDPHCTQTPRFKTHDDVAAVSLQFSSI